MSPADEKNMREFAKKHASLAAAGINLDMLAVEDELDGVTFTPELRGAIRWVGIQVLIAYFRARAAIRRARRRMDQP